MGEAGKEFEDFAEVQDAVRAWFDQNRGEELPGFMKDRLLETERAYEQAKRGSMGCILCLLLLVFLASVPAMVLC